MAARALIAVKPEEQKSLRQQAFLRINRLYVSKVMSRPARPECG
jgi:hypothetical protein